MNKKALLILGGSNDQLFLIKTANEMCIETVVVDGNKNAVGFKFATYSRNIDFSNIEKVIEYCEELINKGINLSGVLTMGSDVPHIIAKIASYFNWISPGEYTAKITTNKFLMKEVFSENQIPIPKYSLVFESKDIIRYWDLWNCEKIIIKPTDSAGSRGVSIIDDKNKIDELFLHAKNNSKKGEVIIEEYIEGNQISTETVIYDKKLSHPGFADRVYNETYNFYPFIMENGGWQPSDANSSIYNEVYVLLDKITKAIKLEKGIMKGDIVYSSKYNKAMVIEVASRISGGDFSASLVPLSSGINYVKTAIQIAMNEEPDFNELNPKQNKIVANRYFFIEEGILEGIENLSEVSNLQNIKKIEFNYKVGDKIPKIQNHGQRVGVFIIADDSRELVQKTIDYVYQTIKFNINGKKVTGHPNYYKVDY